MEPRVDEAKRPGGRPDQPWLMLQPRQQIATVKTIDDQARPPRNRDTFMYHWHRNPCLPCRLKYERFPVHDFPLGARERETKHPPSIKRVNLSFSPRGEQHQFIQADLHGHTPRILGPVNRKRTMMDSRRRSPAGVLVIQLLLSPGQAGITRWQNEVIAADELQQPAADVDGLLHR